MNQVAGLFGSEAEEDVNAIDVTRVKTDGVARFGGGITILQEVVGHLWRTRHLAGPLQAQDQQVKNQPVVLEDEGGELEAADKTVSVRMRHIYRILVRIEWRDSVQVSLTLVCQNCVVLRGDVVG